MPINITASVVSFTYLIVILVNVLVDTLEDDTPPKSISFPLSSLSCLFDKLEFS